MTMTLPRKAVASVAALGAATAVGVAVLPTQAGAAAGDPVTGGQTTITVPTKNLFGAAITKGILVKVNAPATKSLSQDYKSVDYTLPVTGGDADNDVSFGSVEHSGGFTVYNLAKGKKATLSKIKFNTDGYTLSATGSGCPCNSTVTFAYLSGTTSVTYATGETMPDPNGGPDQPVLDPTTPHITSSSLSLTASGAKYLNKQLATTVFKADQVIGSYSSTYTNATY